MLVSPIVQSSGILAANGGGGGCWINNSYAYGGTNGENGKLSATKFAAGGGTIWTNHCDKGGDGGTGLFPPTEGGIGAGGGGGVGKIRINAKSQTIGKASPAFVFTSVIETW
jgi:hypothetical protein